MDTSDAILDVQDLKVRFPVFGGIIPRKKGEVRAVDGQTVLVTEGGGTVAAASVTALRAGG